MLKDYIQYYKDNYISKELYDLGIKYNGNVPAEELIIDDFADFINSSLPIPSLEEQKTIVRKYQETIARAEQVEKRIEEEISEIDNYLLSCLQIKINQKKRKSGLSFIKFSELNQWNTFDSEKSFECKKYPLVTLASISKDKPIYGAAYKTVNKVSDIQKAMENAAKQIETLKQIEALVKKEITEQSAIRAGATEGFVPDL